MRREAPRKLTKGRREAPLHKTQGKWGGDPPQGAPIEKITNSAQNLKNFRLRRATLIKYAKHRKSAEHFFYTIDNENKIQK